MKWAGVPINAIVKAKAETRAEANTLSMGTMSLLRNTLLRNTHHKDLQNLTVVFLTGVCNSGM